MKKLFLTLIMALTSYNLYGYTIGDLTVDGSIIAQRIDVSTFGSVVSFGFIDGSSQTTAGIPDITIFDEGSLQGNATWFDYVGDNISVSVSGKKLTITVSGSGGGDGGGGGGAIFDGTSNIAFSTLSFIAIPSLSGGGQTTFYLERGTYSWTGNHHFTHPSTFTALVTISNSSMVITGLNADLGIGDISFNTWRSTNDTAHRGLEFTANNSNYINISGSTQTKLGGLILGGSLEASSGSFSNDVFVTDILRIGTATLESIYIGKNASVSGQSETPQILFGNPSIEIASGKISWGGGEETVGNQSFVSITGVVRNEASLMIQAFDTNDSSITFKTENLRFDADNNGGFIVGALGDDDKPSSMVDVVGGSLTIRGTNSGLHVFGGSIFESSMTLKNSSITMTGANAGLQVGGVSFTEYMSTTSLDIDQTQLTENNSNYITITNSSQTKQGGLFVQGESSATVMTASTGTFGIANISTMVWRNIPYTAPPNDGTSGQHLETDGTGVLTWEDAAAGGGSGGAGSAYYDGVQTIAFSTISFPNIRTESNSNATTFYVDGSTLDWSAPQLFKSSAAFDSNVTMSSSVFFIVPSSGQIVIQGDDHGNSDGLLLIDYHAAAPGGRVIKMDVDVHGQNDIHAIHIDYIADGVIDGQLEDVLEIIVNSSNSTGGDIHVLDVNKIGTGTVHVVALGVGVEVSVIEQASGEFVGVDGAFSTDGETYTNRISSYNQDSSTTNSLVWENDLDYVVIGSSIAFDEIEFLFETPANKNLNLTFEFSTGTHLGTDITTGGWISFGPTSDIEGGQESGPVKFDSDQLFALGWATTTIGGVHDELYIRIQRHRVGNIGSPTERLILVDSGDTRFFWDKEGDLKINSLVIGKTTASPNVAIDIFNSSIQVNGLNADIGVAGISYNEYRSTTTDRLNELEVFASTGQSVIAGKIPNTAEVLRSTHAATSSLLAEHPFIISSGTLQDGTTVYVSSMSVDGQTILYGDVGIGGEPTGQFEVFGNVFAENDGANVINRMTSYGGQGFYNARIANGTKASPTASVDGDFLGLRFAGHDGSSFSGVRSEIRLGANETFSVSDQGARILFLVTPDGTTSVAEQMRLDHTGNLGINDNDPAQKLSVTGNVAVTGEITASSMTATSTMTTAILIYSSAVINSVPFNYPDAPCTTGQLLKTDGNNNWDCADDSTAASGEPTQHLVAIFDGDVTTKFSTLTVTDPFGGAIVVSGSNASTATVLGSTNPYRSISIPAASWIGFGPSSASWENGGFVISSVPANAPWNVLPDEFMRFNPSTYTRARAQFSMPYETDGSTIAFRVTWRASSGTVDTNVIFSFTPIGYSSGTAGFTAYVTSTSVETTFIADNQIQDSNITQGIQIVNGARPGSLINLVMTARGGDFDGLADVLDVQVIYRQSRWDGRPR